MYYRGAAAAIVVYDITNKESFNGAKSWVKELQRRGDPNVIIALAGNKADLQNKRRVETEVLGSLLNLHHFIPTGSETVFRRERYSTYGNFSKECDSRQRPIRGDRCVSKLISDKRLTLVSCSTETTQKSPST